MSSNFKLVMIATLACLLDGGLAYLLGAYVGAIA